VPDDDENRIAWQAADRTLTYYTTHSHKPAAGDLSLVTMHGQWIFLFGVMSTYLTSSSFSLDATRATNKRIEIAKMTTTAEMHRGNGHFG